MQNLSDGEIEVKLLIIVNEGKPKSTMINGEKIYISKKKINEIKEQEKEGGILSFLIPLFTGIGAAGALASGAAGIASAVNSAKLQNHAKLQQQREHDARVEAALRGNSLFLPEYKKGNRFSEGVKAFAEKTGLDSSR